MAGKKVKKSALPSGSKEKPKSALKPPADANKTTAKKVSPKKPVAPSENDIDYKLLFESISEMVTVADRHYNIIWANRAARETLGIREGRRIKCFAAYHNCKSRPSDCASCSAVKAGETVVYERFEPHLGMHLSIKAMPRLDAGGNAVGAIHIARDITRRQEAEAAVRISEERFRLMAGMLPEFVFETDSKGFFTYVNRKGAELFGYSEEEMTGTLNCLDTVAPEDRARAADNMRRRLAGKQFEAVDYAMLRKDGARFRALIHSSPIIIGNSITGFRGILTDLSGVKKAEESLRQSEEKFRLVFEKSSLGMAFLTPEGVSVECNDRLAEIFGAPKEKLLGVSLPKAIRDERQRAALAEAMAGKSGTYEGGYEVLASGRRIHMRSIFNPVKDAEGKLLGIVSMVEDISERKLAEDALRDSEERFRSMAGMLPEIVYETDPKGVFTYVNKKGLELFGYPEDEIIGRLNCLDTVAPEDRARAADNMRRRVMGEKVEAVDYAMLRRDGTRFPGLIHSSPVAHEGKTTGLRGIVTDLSGVKKAEEELKASRKYIDTIFDAAPT